MAKPFLIFDFDGTIGDTGRLILEVADRLASDRGRGPIRGEEMDVFVSQGVFAFIKAQKVRFWELPGLLKRGRRYFSEAAHKVQLIEGMKEALLDLKVSGFRMGIVTSNLEDTVRDILSRSGADVFDFILAERGVFGKGKVIKKAMERYGISPREAVYIGDELRDVDAARVAGVAMLAVSWGLNSVKAFEGTDISEMVAGPGDIAAAAERAIARRTER